MCLSPQPRAFFQHKHVQKCSEDYSVCPKVLRRLQFFNILTSKCAFRHSRVHFFNISTYKSAPKTTVFLTFSLPNVPFATAACIFQHLNFKKWSRIVSFVTFSLANVLFTTAACNFSTSELQKVLPDCQFFSIFTSECAFRHSGVHFFDI